MVKPPRPTGDTHSPARRSPPDLTLRDQFAMAALTGLLAYADGDRLSERWDHNDFAEEAYSYADAMMKARGE